MHPQNHIAMERFAFVAAARFLGGQLFFFSKIKNCMLSIW